MRIVQVISHENDTEELSSIMTPGLAKYSLESNAMHFLVSTEKFWYLQERNLIKTATRLFFKSYFWNIFRS